MEKTNTRTFLVTVSPYGDQPIPTAEAIDKTLFMHVGGLVVVVDYQVPAAGKVAFEFVLGQRVCSRRDGKIGRINGLEFDSEGQITARVLLEEPYRHPEITLSDGFKINASETWRQTWHAWEMQGIGDAGQVDDEQRKTSEACAAWFEVQS